MKAKPVKIWAFFAVLILTCVCTAGAHTINIGGQTINLQDTCSSDHKLNVFDGTNTYCAEATTDTLSGTLHVMHNGTIYSICDGACGGGGGEWVMPEEPDDPIVLPSSCTWTQTNENAYLLSDGNQYFDTMVPIDSRDNIEVILQVNNGKNAKILGTVGSSCKYDVTLNTNGGLRFRIGDTSGGNAGTLDSTVATQKNSIKTANQKIQGNYVYKYYKLNGTTLNSGDKRKICTDNNSTMLVLKNDYTTTNNTLSGGIKLYRIRQWDSSGALIHDFQPVAQGTNVCGYTALTNAMWDSVTKKLYYPAGTGQMEYGVDP